MNPINSPTWPRPSARSKQKSELGVGHLKRIAQLVGSPSEDVLSRGYRCERDMMEKAPSFLKKKQNKNKSNWFIPEVSCINRRGKIRSRSKANSELAGPWPRPRKQRTAGRVGSRSLCCLALAAWPRGCSSGVTPPASSFWVMHTSAPTVHIDEGLASLFCSFSRVANAHLGNTCRFLGWSPGRWGEGTHWGTVPS